MSAEETIELAEQLGLHWDHDDDPAQDEETIILWHDTDEADGGLLIRIRDGQADLADLKNWGMAESMQVAGEDGGRALAESIAAYAGLCNQRPRLSHRKAKERAAPTLAGPKVRKRRGECRPRTQRKEGAFKAVDPLGHFYYVEVFREIRGEKQAELPRLVTVDGEEVEWIAKGRYRLGRERIDLSSTDPAAP